MLMLIELTRDFLRPSFRKGIERSAIHLANPLQLASSLEVVQILECLGDCPADDHNTVMFVKDDPLVFAQRGREALTLNGIDGNALVFVVIGDFSMKPKSIL